MTSEQSREEVKAGRKAADKLKSFLKNRANSVFKRKSGQLLDLKTGIMKRKDDGSLRGITVSMPGYGFILHHGFSGQKKNGVFQRLKKTEWIIKAIDNSGVTQYLAEEISQIRAEEVISQLKF